MLISAKVAHHIEGRTRLRFPGERRNAVFFQSLEEKLGREPSVERLETNPTTGSVVIHHATPLSHLEWLGRQLELFEVEWLPTEPLVRHRWLGRVKEFDARLRRLSRGRQDLDTLGAFVCFGLGLFQVWRGKALPAATTLFEMGGRFLAGGGDVFSGGDVPGSGERVRRLQEPAP